jgi:hypothetical protein
MSGGAHVGSVDAVRDFRAALVTFAHEAHESLISFDMESRRTLDWLLETQPKFWQQEVRRSDELLTQAKIELERCRNSRLPGGEAPSCMEERKAVDRARHRKQYAEDKFEATRKWGYIANRESIEYSGRANQLTSMFDAQFPAAIALFERVLNSLEAYLAVSHDNGSATGVAEDTGAPAVSRPLDALPEGVADVNSAADPNAIDSASTTFTEEVS